MRNMLKLLTQQQKTTKYSEKTNSKQTNNNVEMIDLI